MQVAATVGCRNCLSRDCGHCCFGCPTGDKQDMTTTFLADAAGDGAKIITGIYADSVITCANTSATDMNGHAVETRTNSHAASNHSSEQQSHSNHAEHAAPPRKQQAEGVVAYLGSGKDRVKCVFKAPIVVSSAGSINSPALLLRSGITVNGNVGRNLRLHPAATAPAVFSEKEHGKINMWQGPMMTAYSPDAPDWEGGGYGPMVSTPPVSFTLILLLAAVLVIHACEAGKLTCINWTGRAADCVALVACCPE